MKKNQLEFMIKLLDSELINISDACDCENYDIKINRAEMSKACKLTQKILKKEFKTKKNTSAKKK